MDKFDEYMKEAATQLAILCETPIEDSDNWVHDALAKAFKYGSCNDKAKAVMLASRWMWAHCEKQYHSSNPQAR